jgi:ionotropic glutamate receptor
VYNNHSPHIYATWGLEVVDVARNMGMMESGYVWIATDWLSTILDTESSLPPTAMDGIQGVLTLRMHTPDSELKRKFVSRWSNLTGGVFGLNTYGLYAYDTVWLLAHALDAFLNKGGNISFSNDPRLTEFHGGNLHFDSMSIFDGGNMLLTSILEVNISGVSGPIKFTSDGNLIGTAYEVINVIGTTGIRRIGYWSNSSGLSTLPPEELNTQMNISRSNHLYGVIWPGQTTVKPRGWVFSSNGKQLRVGVPVQISFRECASRVDGSDVFHGYCIDVFNAALALLPYAVSYKFIPFGDGHRAAKYDNLLQMITTNVS